MIRRKRNAKNLAGADVQVLSHLKRWWIANKIAIVNEIINLISRSENLGDYA
jgi:hypothetical protein